MTDAEATVKHAIFSGLIQNWHLKDQSNWAELTRDEIFNQLFASHLYWAVEEYLNEIHPKPSNPLTPNRSKK